MANTLREKNLNMVFHKGSVLGPILLTIYTSPMCDVVRKHGLKFHLYTEDTQLYLPFDSVSQLNADSVIQKINACIPEIKLWMATNKLKFTCNTR